MKILWLSHLVPYPPKGGVLQRSYNLIRELSRYHDVYLLAFIQKDLINRTMRDYDSGVAESRNVLSGFCRRIDFVEIPCENNPIGKEFLALRSLFSTLPYTVNWLTSTKMKQLIEQWCKEITFDAVHFDTISLAQYIPEANNSCQVLDHHNIESAMMYRRKALERKLARKLYFWQEAAKLERYEKKICRRFSINLTCSELDSTRLLEIDPTLNVHEIPNGVDTDYFSPQGTTPLNNSLVFAGGLKWYPNRRAMLYFAEEIWPLLKNEIPDIRIDIIGSDPPGELTTLAARDDHFHVHGFVDDVRPFLDRASIYVCPITDGGGTKLKILDALSMGKAIVADPIACEGINVTNRMNLIFASTPRDYVDAICELLRDEKKRTAIGNSARELALREYGFKNIGLKLSEVFESLDKKPQPSL